MKILFVCSGNTCRSPMAEAIYNAYAAKRGLEPAESAGTNVAAEGEPASRNACLAVRDYGGSLESHKARAVTRELIESADRVYCMTAYNRAMLLILYPEFAAKYRLIDENGVPDPYGGTLDDYVFCAARIALAVRKILGEQSDGR